MIALEMILQKTEMVGEEMGDGLPTHPGQRDSRPERFTSGSRNWGCLYFSWTSFWTSC